MKKLAPWLVALVAGAGLGLLGWYMLRTPEQAANGRAAEIVDKKYDRATFFDDFDWMQKDGRVTFEEFSALYGEGEGKHIFTEGPGQPALTAQEAFARWDRDRNGVVDELDFRLIENTGIDNFRKAALAKNLSPEIYFDKMLALNAHQQRVFDDTMAAESLGQLFWRGQFLALKYFEEWGSVTTSKGDEFTGFVSRNADRFTIVVPTLERREFNYDAAREAEKPAATRMNVRITARPAEATEHEGLKYTDWGRVTRGGNYPLELEGWVLLHEGKLYVLQAVVKLRSVKQADARFTPQADAPDMKYVAAARVCKFDDIEANLALARQCAAGGLRLEAMHYHARALVFKRDIAESLAYCGLKLQGDFFEAAP